MTQVALSTRTKSYELGIRTFANGVCFGATNRLYCDAELILQRGKQAKLAENITGRFSQDRYLARLSEQRPDGLLIRRSQVRALVGEPQNQ